MLPELQAADILAYRIKPRSPLVSELVALGERLLGEQNGKQAFSHVAIVDENGTGFYEAYWPAVRWRPLHWSVENKTEQIEVFRFPGLSPGQLADILSYARRHVGERYDILAILTFGMVTNHHAAVCSEYVWRAYHAAGITLCPWEKLVSPDEISGSKFLQREGAEKLQTA